MRAPLIRIVSSEFPFGVVALRVAQNAFRQQYALERISKIMTQNADEHFARSVNLQQLLSLPLKRDEDVDLAPKHARVDRLPQIVDGADLISLEHPGRLSRARRHQNNRNAPRLFDAPHKRRKLEPIHFRHLHVDDGDRDIAFKQNIESGAPGQSRDDLDVVPA